MPVAFVCTMPLVVLQARPKQGKMARDQAREWAAIAPGAVMW